MNYTGRGLPLDILLPNEKADLLDTSGWDLTPAAYLEYNGLAEKYKTIKDECPVEGAIWNTEDVFDLLVS